MRLIRNFLFFAYLFVSGNAIFAQPINYSSEIDIPYYSLEKQESDDYINSRCKLDIYFPENQKDFSTIVWFHGGGLRAGNKQYPEYLKEKGVAIVSVNYRLFPKIEGPKYIEDAAAAVAWTFNNIEEYGGNPDLIFVSGHSAGGYLTSMIGLDKKWLETHDIDADRIRGLIPFSGHAITHFTLREERKIPGTQVIVDELAPIYYVRKDAPPYLIITGDRDLELLGRFEENAFMWRMMKIVGHKECEIIEIEGYNHGEMVEPALPLLLKEVKRLSVEE